MRLKNLIKNFHHKHLTKKHQSELRDYQILHDILDDVFPTQSSIDSFLEILSTLKNRKSLEMYSLTTLPLHFRNDEWMTGFFEKRLKNQKPTLNIDPKHIAYFIRHDSEFSSMRDQYEQDILFTEMSRLINLIKSGNGANPESVPYRIKNSINAVEDFYQAFQGRLTQKLNFDQHTVEIFLEKNSNSWRPQLMDIAFTNQCINPLKPCRKYVEEQIYLTTIDNIYAQKTTWTELEEYKYYQKHNSIINELGTQTEAMKMKREVAESVCRAFEHKYNAITNQIFNNIKVITDNHNID